MKQVIFQESHTFCTGCTLRDPSLPLEGSMALHTTTQTEMILQNRAACSKALHIPMEHWCLAQQTHSAHAQEVFETDKGKGAYSMQDAFPCCDALYTKEKQILIGVFTADCVPIILYDPSSHYIAAIHSGWPGTVKQITVHTLEQLIKKGLHPATTRVWIGPCIHQSSFQIRQDVIDQIRALPFDTTPYLQFQADGSALCDNVGLNIHMLRSFHIPQENIWVSPMDTFIEKKDCFSYRRDHTIYRHFSYIYLK